MYYFKLISLFAILSGFCASVHAVFPVVVTDDLVVIYHKITALNDALQAYPVANGSLAGAYAIAGNLEIATFALDTTTTDTQALAPLPLSNEQFLAYIDHFENFLPSFIAALQRLILVKPSIFSFPVAGVPGLFHSRIKNLSYSTNYMAAALVAKAPEPSLAIHLNIVKEPLDQAFALVIAAYNI